jgi:hypothetical protein
MQPELNRIEPQGPSAMYQTYSITRRPDTLIKAVCEQVGCQAWAYGWDTKIDESTALGQAQAAHIRTKAGRTYTERRDGEITVFRFEPHQRCFADHRTIAERFTVLSGDYRNYTGIQRVHRNGLDWAEDFGEHQIKVHDQIEKG